MLIKIQKRVYINICLSHYLTFPANKLNQGQQSCKYLIKVIDCERVCENLRSYVDFL